MQNRTFTFDLQPTGFDSIADALRRADFTFTHVPDSLWQARKAATIATLYKTGKLVVQGAEALLLVSWLSKKRLIPPPSTRDTSERIGTDEAGKGDYFGPLVTAGVLVTRNTENDLLVWGIRDSKTISDDTVQRLAAQVKRNCPHSVVAIGPEKYNELQRKLGTVNKVLGWAHARAIENILQAHECGLAIADQFGDEAYIRRALLQRGKEIELFQMPHAEQDMAVAAASILARAEFLDKLRSLSAKYSMAFPKGASQKVIDVAKKFVAVHGSNRLKEVAKIHFKTTKEVLGSS